MTAEKQANDDRRMTFSFDVLEQEVTNESDGDDKLGARQANIVKNSLFKKIKM